MGRAYLPSLRRVRGRRTSGWQMGTGTALALGDVPTPQGSRKQIRAFGATAATCNFSSVAHRLTLPGGKFGREATPARQSGYLAEIWLVRAYPIFG